MAYTRLKEPNCPIPADPGVICTYVPLTQAESNVPVKVPWNSCQFVYAYSTYVSDETSGILDKGDCEIDFELDAADGTELMSITVASGSAVGTIDEATVSDALACTGLNNQSTIMIEVDAALTSTLGGFNIYMYFEPDL